MPTDHKFSLRVDELVAKFHNLLSWLNIYYVWTLVWTHYIGCVSVNAKKISEFKFFIPGVIYFRYFALNLELVALNDNDFRCLQVFPCKKLDFQ